MKRAIAIALGALACLGASPATAAEPLTLLLAGGNEENRIFITVSADGRSYSIESVVPLEVGGSVCTHPEGQETVLLCEAVPIGGFEVNAGGGDDLVVVDPKVRIPTTLRGGSGNDRLVGGGGDDKLIGGAGNDLLNGRGGNDWLLGGPDNDLLFGGSGDDLLSGGPGVDRLHGQSGTDQVSDE